ncbi:MAG: ethanolamine utilization protein EutH, partial [Clostridia bacterium]|nr:ethanolamine utilization protein EutH [Clostridia bacterium]
MEILMYVFAAFALLGAADRIIGNRFGVGREFEKGIEAMAPLALAMVGMICISPALTNLLIPVIGPFAKACGFDPSAIAGILFANDMGGAALAADLAIDPIVGGFHGLIVAAMMGATISFTIPTALSTIDKAFHKEVLTGILCGISTIPVGCIVSGLMLGMSLPALIMNLLPVTVIAVLTCIGIAKFPQTCVKVFSVFGRFIVALITVGLAGGIFASLTGKTLIPGMADIADGFAVVAEIAVVLSGVFPLIYVLSKLLARPLSALAKRF